MKESMRHRLTFAFGLAGMLFTVPPARTAPTSSSGSSKEPSVTWSHGIRTTRDGDNVLKEDMTGKGAVLCNWQFYELVRAVGRECYKGEDTVLQTELDRSVRHIDEFIIKNSKQPVGMAELEAEVAKGLEQVHSSGNICVGDPAKMYEAVRRGGATALRKETGDLLSIPREPVINPCL